MKQRYLEVTFSTGKPFAAYLYLPQVAGPKAARTLDGGHGLRIDLDEHGGLLGLEITAPSLVTAGELNAVLARYRLRRSTKKSGRRWRPEKCASGTQGLTRCDLGVARSHSQRDAGGVLKVMLDRARSLRVTVAASALDDASYHYGFAGPDGSRSIGLPR